MAKLKNSGLASVRSTDKAGPTRTTRQNEAADGVHILQQDAPDRLQSKRTLARILAKALVSQAFRQAKS